jgi:hypothetical protein
MLNNFIKLVLITILSDVNVMYDGGYGGEIRYS